MTARAKIRSKYRDLNARGRGTEAYRLLAGPMPSTTLYWADRHPDALAVGGQRLPYGSIRSDDRHASCSVEVPLDTGLLVVEIEKSIGRGTEVSYSAGWLTSAAENRIDWNGQHGYLPVKHCGVKKNGDSYTHVVQIGTERFELRS